MIFKNLQRVEPTANPKAAEQADIEERKLRRDSKLVDVAHEAAREEAAQNSADLEGLVRMGWPLVQREKFKGRVRRKVWDAVSENFGPDGAEIVDEVTEKIVETAEADPFYKRMFEEEGE